MRASAVAALYDAKAGEYDEHFRRRVDRAEDRVLYGWLAPHVEGREVLDVACGTGALLDHLRPRRWYGVDIAPAMLEIANSRCKVLASLAGVEASLGMAHDWSQLTRGDLMARGLNGAFDTALCLWSFSYFPDAVSALANMATAVRPGGTVIVHAYDARYPDRSHYVLNGHAGELVTPWTASGLRMLAEGVGLQVRDIRGFRFTEDGLLSKVLPITVTAAKMRLSSKLLPAAAGLTRVMIARRPQ